MSAVLSLRLTWQVVLKLILSTTRIYLLAGLFVAILFALQWLFNIDQLLEVVFGDNPLSTADRVDFLLDGFVNIFRFADDIVPVSMILIALLQAITITLFMVLKEKKASRAQGLSIGLSLGAVGCVACGGSILTPLLGFVATNVSVGFAESVSTVLLLVALVLSYISMNRVALLVAQSVKTV